MLYHLLVLLWDSNHGKEECDELLCSVFPDCYLYSIAEILRKGIGLSASLLSHCVPYLQAFSQVMAQWPKCPPLFYDPEHNITTNLPKNVILVCKHALVDVHVNTFFEQAG